MGAAFSSDNNARCILFSRSDHARCVCVLMPVAVRLLSTGLVAATFGTPADVIKTRVMNQPTDPATGTHARTQFARPAHPPKGVQV